MLFMINRFPTQSIRSRIGRKFDFDLSNNAANNSVFFYERSDDEAYMKIGSIEFLSRLKQSAYSRV